MNANQYAEAIKANVRDWYSGKIDYDEFGRRAYALWDSVPEGPLYEEVVRLVAPKMSSLVLKARKEE